VKKLWIVLALLALFTLVSAVGAKGEAARITITGEEIEGEIEVLDQETLALLSFMQLEQSLLPRSFAPEGLGEGYEIARYFQEEGSERYFPFDRVSYHPDPDGGQGYIQYLGIVNGSSEYDGRWFRPSADGEAALRDVLGLDEPAVARGSDFWSTLIRRWAGD
jgi:hypothetical protein